MAVTPPANLALGAIIDEPWVDAVTNTIIELQTAALAGVWTAPVLSGTWLNFGGIYQIAQYRKIGDVVELRGVVKSGAASSSVFTLPAGFRPPAANQFATVAGGAFGYITCRSDGTVTADVGSTASFDLAPCRFSTVA